MSCGFRQDGLYWKGFAASPGFETFTGATARRGFRSKQTVMNDFRLSEPDPLSDRTPRILSYFPDAGNGTRGDTEKMVKKEKSDTCHFFIPLILLGETHFSGATVRARTRVREACRVFQRQKRTPASGLQGGRGVKGRAGSMKPPRAAHLPRLRFLKKSSGKYSKR